MKTFVCSLLAAAILAPLSANASPITWNLSGVVTAVNDKPTDGGFPPFIAPGAPYSLAVTFDTAVFSPINPCGFSDGQGGCGSTYGNLLSPSAVQFSIDFGGNDCGDAPGTQPCSPDLHLATVRSGIVLFNDFLAPDGTGKFDGVTLALYPGIGDTSGFGALWTLTLAGDPGLFASMPTLDVLNTLDPKDLPLQRFNYCDVLNYTTNLCTPGSGTVVGSQAVAVPEPGTLTLLCGAFAGMGAIRARRRRPALRHIAQPDNRDTER